MKGIVLAGGLGTRLYPLTAINNKHLLPVYNKPMVYYPIQLLVDAGVTDIMIVTGGNNAGDFLKLLKNGKEFGLNKLHYTYQEGENGIAAALGICEHFVDQDRMVVVLGDNIFELSIGPYVRSFEQQPSGGRILLKAVPDPQRFGVPVLEHDRLVCIEEKPEHPHSPYAVTGVYMYDARVFEVIKHLSPSGRGELEISDVNNWYIKQGELEYDIVDGWWTDAGTISSLFHASCLIAQQHNEKICLSK